MLVCSKKEKAGYYLFLLPAYIIFMVFIFWPVIQSFYLSFTRYNIMTITAPEFVGLDNYLFIFRDEVFWISVRNTVVFVLGTIPLKMAIGLAVAMILNGKHIGKLRTAYNVSLYVPFVAPIVASSIIWMLLFNPGSHGIMNIILSKIGLSPLGWFSDSDLSLLTVMLLVIWRDTGFVMLIYLAGLMAIPREIYEALALDPVSPWQKFRHITFPLLKPTTVFIVITQAIESFQVFTPVYVITGGGPGHSSTTIINYLYTRGFTEFTMGIASAVAFVLFVVLLILTIIQRRIYKAEEIAYD